MKDFFQKKYSNYFLKPFLKRYLKKARVFNYNNLKLKIYPSVFHPKYFFSTGVLVTFLDKFDLNNKTFCEVGAGSALLSFVAYQKGAKVVCLDLNETAVAGVVENFNNNFKESPNQFKIYHSNLFDSVPLQKFEMIVINPPYFFKEIIDDRSMAWNCGPNGEYFKKLFEQLYNYSDKDSEIYIVLAENCDIGRIREIAQGYKLTLNLVVETKIKWEKNYIFRVSLCGNFN